MRGSAPLQWCGVRVDDGHGEVRRWDARFALVLVDVLPGGEGCLAGAGPVGTGRRHVLVHGYDLGLLRHAGDPSARAAPADEGEYDEGDTGASRGDDFHGADPLGGKGGAGQRPTGSTL